MPDTPPTFPEMTDIPSMPAANTLPLDIPPIIASSQTPKKGKGKIIATILGILLLIGAVGAGVILVGQQQDIREKAAGGNLCKAEEGSCVPDNYTCSEGSAKMDCPSGKKCGFGTCTPPTTPACNLGQPCTTSLNCPGQCEGISGKPETWFCSDIADDCPPTSPPPPTTCTESCQPDHLDPIGYCGSTGNQYWCQKVIGDYGVLKSCYGTCRDPYTYSSGDYCLDTQHGRNCDAGIRCSTSPDPRCIATTPPGSTPTPTPTPPSAACTAVKAYDTNWNLLTQTQLSTLKAGDKVRFTISGSPADKIDKAKFTINGVLKPETTNKKPGTNEYYYEYTIPAGVSSFTVTAQIHHLTLGWF